MYLIVSLSLAMSGPIVSDLNVAVGSQDGKQ
jgi:hypothetical protein